MCQMLQLIPITAENACGVDYELTSAVNGPSSNKFVTTIKVCFTDGLVCLLF